MHALLLLVALPISLAPSKAHVIFRFIVAGWSSSVARWAHNPEVVGSNPAPATTYKVTAFSHFDRMRLLFRSSTSAGHRRRAPIALRFTYRVCSLAHESVAWEPGSIFAFIRQRVPIERLIGKFVARDFVCGAVVDMVSAVPLTCIVDDNRRGVEQLGSSLGS